MTHKTPSDAVSAARGAVPMPSSLAARLRRIPTEVVVCRDVDRLISATRQRARGRQQEAAVERHMDDCARCRQVYGVLQVAFAEAARPVPFPLLARLRRVARRPRVPRAFFEVDLRLATAASLLMGLLLQPVASEVANATRWATGQTRTVSTQWLSSGGSRVWDWGRRGAEQGLEGGTSAMRAVDRSWQWVRTGTEQIFSRSLTSMERLIERQGDIDGDTRESDD